ncbi:sialate O-acetylesterase [Halochromatium roseum]|uniref:sialate O-acetylesterase n=1 Tax=Halochromatium roseum TaxID=391920 RepID=UPI001912FDD1|nr:sialate O-acetylesterase [Halochromatium roseum]MBK5940369.1 hypothetical protein [Halochromatium roseum]
MTLARLWLSILFSVLLLPEALMASQEGKHLFILSGQSNMEGMHYEKDFIPHVKRALGKQSIIVVWDAKGGEPISRWYKDWSMVSGKIRPITGDLYSRLLAKVRKVTEGKEIKSVTFIWMQGETDALSRDGSVYGYSLIGLVSQLQQDLKRTDLNVVIGRISDYGITNKRLPHWTRVREEQVRFAKSAPCRVWVDTDDLNDGLSRKGMLVRNDLHYSELGYVILGRRFAESAINLIEKRANHQCEAR